MSDLHELAAKVLGLDLLVRLICVHLPRSTREDLLESMQRLRAESTVALQDDMLTEIVGMLKEQITDED